ncbi:MULTISPECIES: hypothetical protein [Silvimonas]|uniref:hypothetical protein n=1 Tax=Silvimonas TaxID=300264 RepID=UPI0024B35BB1|nr:MULTISPECIES: hypothetical protein [Silvimonas]MDR3429926.1 hypothetical protein [Silvimonas sp.]
MIDTHTARAFLLNKYQGAWSAFYYAGTAGIVQSFDHLREECAKVTAPGLAEWIEYQAQNAPQRKTFFGGTYWLLPWSSEKRD